MEVKMKIGTIREIKRHEYRVGLTPSCVQAYISRGHEVFVEAGAGANAGFEDADYQAVGATIVDDRKAVFKAPGNKFIQHVPLLIYLAFPRCRKAVTVPR